MVTVPGPLPHLTLWGIKLLEACANGKYCSRRTYNNNKVLFDHMEDQGFIKLDTSGTGERCSAIVTEVGIEFLKRRGRY